MTTSNSSNQNSHPIAAVRVGMRVVDSAGAVIGTAEHVQMGDPREFNVDRQTFGDAESFPRYLLETLTGPEPDVPPGRVPELVRRGYVKVNGRDLLDTDTYVAADEIATVDGDVVRLSVPRTQLATES
jgi:hypothetical protein